MRPLLNIRCDVNLYFFSVFNIAHELLQADGFFFGPLAQPNRLENSALVAVIDF
jgi:hypothetical protein